MLGSTYTSEKIAFEYEDDDEGRIRLEAAATSHPAQTSPWRKQSLPVRLYD
jgi:hypothetical protein